ncbi:uncharacterized protein LOC127719823 [Mytilus californianus]|uniref:uncharacterized protein LOC127719823 n=1 Tax=Mytilus californianus TaxID=6549 RepID=UPI0022471CFB|nr:uncharacterized protein LOC127719823 [Mytilus californianus]
MADFGFYAFVFLIIQLILLEVSESCITKNDSININPEEMVARSKYVLYGEVVKKITPDPRTPNIGTSYGVEFMIKCIYKGNPNTDEKLKNKETVIIAGAGIVRPNCYSFEVKPKEDVTNYVVFLQDDGNHLVPSYGAPDNIAYQDLYELILVCDLDPVGPSGGALKDDCPRSEPPDCVRYKFPTTPKPVTVEVEKPQLLTTPAPEPEPKPKPEPKEPVKGDTKGQETNDGGGGKNGTAAIPKLTVFSIFLGLLSALYVS